MTSASNSLARIMVVDDEEMVRRTFQRMLARAIPQAAVDMVADGSEALDLFCECRHDVCVMDLKMPVMDGRQAFIEIARHCDAKGWEMPAVIFCTGYAPPKSLQDLVARGGHHDLISKPVRADDLVRRVRERLP